MYQLMRRKAFFAALQIAGTQRRLRRSLVGRDTLLVLNLHRVAPECKRFLPVLTPRLFEHLLSFLVTNAQVVTFSDLAEPRNVANDRVPVILSFDDGYKDFVEYAMPILDRFGLRANQNVIPECVLTGEPPWSVRLWEFLAAAPPEILSRISLPSLRPPVANGSIASVRPFGTALRAYLRSLPHSSRQEAWGHLQPLMDEVGAEQTPMMSLSDVKQAAGVHEVGAHSYAHDTMGVETKEFFQKDLSNCSTFFRQQLGMPLSIYAFPYGSHTQEQLDVLACSGVNQILLVEDRVSSRHSAVHPRLSFGAVSRPEVQIRAMGWTRKRR